MVVELMGHRRLAGLVTEAELFGAVMLRIDIPTGLDVKARCRIYTTQFYNAAAVYCATPISESDAVQIAAGFRPKPYDKFDLHKEALVNLPICCPHCGEGWGDEAQEAIRE